MLDFIFPTTKKRTVSIVMKSIVHERWTAQYLSFGLQLANYCFYINFGEEREREKDKLTDETKENGREKRGTTCER